MPCTAQMKRLKQQQKEEDAAGAAGKLPGAKAELKGGAYYKKYILEDLKPWAEHGITKVGASSPLAAFIRSCLEPSQ